MTDLPRETGDELKACIAATALLESVLRGNPRNLLVMMDEVYEAYGATYPMSPVARVMLKANMARAILHQSTSGSYRERGILLCGEILSILNRHDTFDSARGALSTGQRDELKRACDLMVRVGLSQHDSVLNELSIHPHMEESSVLVEQARIERAIAPNIGSPHMPEAFKAAHRAYKSLQYNGPRVEAQGMER